MLVIPFLVLFLTAATGWLLRKRHEGVVWGSTTVGFGLAYLSVLALRLDVPQRVHLSVWQPAALFSSDLVLQLDLVGWTLAVSVAALLLAVTLLSPEIAPDSGAFPRVFLAVYGVLGLAAMLAGNLLTVVMTWALVDGGGFVFSLALDHDARSVGRQVNRLAVQGASTVLVLAATVPLGAEASLGTSAAGGSWGVSLLACATLLRLIPVDIRRDTRPAGGGLLFGVAAQLVSAGMGLAMLARELAGGVAPGGLLPLAWLAAVVFVLACGVWGLTGGLGRSSGTLLVAIGSMGLILAGVGGEAAARGVSAAGAVALVAGGLSALGEPRETWHRVWPIIVGTVVLGTPGTVGHAVLASLGAALGSMWTLGIAVLLVAGLGLLVAGFLDFRGFELSRWNGGEELVRTSYSAGLTVLGVTPFLLALGVGYLISLDSLILFAGALGVAGGLRYVDSRFGLPVWSGWEAMGTFWASRFAFLRRVLEALVNGLQSLGSMFEGEASVLWVLMILVVLGLTLGAS